MKFFCDKMRHLVCMPYSTENLHEMARRLGIKRSWYHSSAKYPHYDIPKKRFDEISAQCTVVSPKEILAIVKGKSRVEEVFRSFVRQVLLEYNVQSGVHVYHRSPIKFEPGDKLTARIDPEVGYHRYKKSPRELLLEKIRAEKFPELPSRMNCVFGSFVPHSRFASRGHLYLIKPVGKTFVTDSTIIDRMTEQSSRSTSDYFDEYHKMSPEEKMQFEDRWLAEDYWKGAEPSREKLADLEILMETAVVIERLSSKIDVVAGDTIKIPSGVALNGFVYVNKEKDESEVFDGKRGYKYVPVEEVISRLRKTPGVEVHSMVSTKYGARKLQVTLRPPASAEVARFNRTDPGEWESRQFGSTKYADVMLGIAGVPIHFERDESVKFYELVRSEKIKTVGYVSK